MATVAHNSLTDPNLHEPKGVAAATADKVYVSNGAGSGTWQKITEDQINSGSATAGQVLVADGSGGVMYHSMPHGRISFNNVGAPYTLTYPATYTKLAPTTVAGGSPTAFTEATTARLTYTGTQQQHFHIACTISCDQAAGANRDVRFKIYKSGVAVDSTEVIQTTVSGNKVSTAIHADVLLSTNDYLEVFAQNDGASGDIRIYGFYLFAMGMHEV